MKSPADVKAPEYRSEINLSSAIFNCKEIRMEREHIPNTTFKQYMENEAGELETQLQNLRNLQYKLRASKKKKVKEE